MLLKNTLIASLSGLAAAAANDTQYTNNPSFDIVALRSASKIHFSKVAAADSSLLLGLTNQDASCAQGTKADGATFYMKNGELFLYKTDSPSQQVYVDRSGMGQGRVSYVSGTNPPRNGESSGWVIDGDGNLTFDGSSLKACLGSGDVWVIWASGDSGNPPGYDECLGFTARTSNVKDPISCSYTQN
ncbi:hypothetical protein FSARC_10487 [Fusarium sarcochroum]|uniref:Cell wall protein PhiA n=1 Tax=Fusarium sarcochroum TaxID=1208366 RepID=A0A8H4TM77_9HYPO|nr:hypothetical protein FSARC_10487 [Fusarium sarcochroum]